MGEGLGEGSVSGERAWEWRGSGRVWVIVVSVSDRVKLGVECRSCAREWRGSGFRWACGGWACGAGSGECVCARSGVRGSG